MCLFLLFFKYFLSIAPFLLAIKTHHKPLLHLQYLNGRLHFVETCPTSSKFSLIQCLAFFYHAKLISK
jgi:hypothetical protein